MNSTLLLYLWVKLDDFIALISNNYGISIFMAIVCLIYIVLISTFIPDDEGQNYPLSGFLSDDEDEVKQLTKKRRYAIKLVSYILIIQIACNVIATLLPNTKQLAVIYTVSTGVQSETFNALKSLDSDFAAYLKREAKGWLNEQSHAIVKENLAGEKK